MNSNVKNFLEKNHIQYEIAEDGRIAIEGSLDLRGLTSIPEGFNPTVGGYLYLSGLTSKKPKTKNLPKNFSATLRASIEVRFNAKGFTIADGILARIIQARGAVKKIMVWGKTEVSWLASDDKGRHAHGPTMKEALEELAFKTGERDIEIYRNMPADTVKTPQEWAFIYRMCTGACKSGVKHFMSSKGDLKENYTLAEIIEQTQGAFGHEKFKEVVNG